jgi:AmmeMemoRadiSam system protein B
MRSSVPEGTVRQAAVAGSWYPGSEAALRREVEAHLSAAGAVGAPGRLVALVSPHAGLRYSGPVAAHGYALVRASPPATVVLVGPAHRAAFEGVAVWARGAFETPLGRAPVDQDLAAALLRADPVCLDDGRAHRDEHSLEMQLPFLQAVAPQAAIVPLLMGSQERAEVEALSGALVRALAGRPALLVASSDLSHYETSEVAARLDGAVLRHLERLDADGLMERLETTDGHACGGGPMVAVMKAACVLGADQATVLRYADSGDVPPHDKQRVVGYVSAALTRGAA